MGAGRPLRQHWRGPLPAPAVATAGVHTCRLLPLSPNPCANTEHVCVCVVFVVQQASKYKSTITGAEIQLATRHQDIQDDRDHRAHLFGGVPHAKRPAGGGVHLWSELGATLVHICATWKKRRSGEGGWGNVLLLAASLATGFFRWSWLPF